MKGRPDSYERARRGNGRGRDRRPLAHSRGIPGIQAARASTGVPVIAPVKTSQQLRCSNELFVDAAGESIHIAEMAHVFAANDGGPRAKPDC